MATKDKALNLRISEAQRTELERAAALEGVPVSVLVLGAAHDKAQAVLREHSSMTVPSDVFDQLLAWLDEPPRPLAPSLAKALERLPDIVEQR